MLYLSQMQVLQKYIGTIVVCLCYFTRLNGRKGMISDSGQRVTVSLSMVSPCLCSVRWMNTSISAKVAVVRRLHLNGWFLKLHVQPETSWYQTNIGHSVHGWYVHPVKVLDNVKWPPALYFLAVAVIVCTLKHFFIICKLNSSFSVLDLES